MIRTLVTRVAHAHRVSIQFLGKDRHWVPSAQQHPLFPKNEIFSVPKPHIKPAAQKDQKREQSENWQDLPEWWNLPRHYWRNNNPFTEEEIEAIQSGGATAVVHSFSP